MKRTFIHLANALLVGTALAATLATLAAQQVTAPNRQAARGARAAQQAAKADEKADKAEKKEARKPAIDIPKRTPQQIQTARLVERRYVARFQAQVGVNDDQSGRLGPLLGAYIQKQQALADQRVNLQKRLQELTAQQGSTDDIQEYVRAVDLTENQMANTRNRFLAQMDAELTPEQRGRLRVYLNQTNQEIRKRIQESTK
jgi:hypothetical protein